MDFELSIEQVQLKDSIARVIADAYPSLRAREERRRNPAGGFAPETWRRFAELGILGLTFAEQEGGLGGGPVESMLVMDAIGKGLALEPYLATVVLGGGALRLAGNAAQKAQYIPRIIDGSLLLAVAFQEHQSRYELHNVETRAVRRSSQYELNGHKRLIINGDSAHLLVVSARVAGAAADAEGISLFLVPSDAPGVTIEGYPTQDGGRAADATFKDVVLAEESRLGSEGAGGALLERIVELGVAALAAEAVGAMEALMSLTVDYLKTRKQFGTTIGSFQSLQHRAVDMLIMLEQARSMAMYAAMMVDTENAEARQVALSAAKVQINKSARFLGQQAIQLHGGIGMTMEYIGAHYFKRLAMIEYLLGDTPHHLARVAEA